MIAQMSRGMAARQSTYTGDVWVILFGAGFCGDKVGRGSRYEREKGNECQEVQKREMHLIWDGTRTCLAQGPKRRELETCVD